MRKFNVTGLCIPDEDYMVDISGKIEQIKKLVDGRCYFTINRARQYGKTTALNELKKRLENEYICIKISFEGLGNENFDSSGAFCKVFIKYIVKALGFTSTPKEYINEWANGDINDFDSLSDHITDMCEEKRVVLMIDEVDKMSNNQVFVHFLSMLRKKFLARKEGNDYTFHSVILAGVYDIKNIKLKMINEGLYTPTEAENKIYNSLWNIAADFTVNMFFDPKEIATMLTVYEEDYNTGMDIAAIAAEIYSYTSGYPFLVSRICQHIDEKLSKDWTLEGVQKAVKIILDESNTLFDDVFKNLENNTALSKMIYELLILGEEKPFVIDNMIINTGVMYGFLKNSDGRITVANKIFELSPSFGDRVKETKKVAKNGRYEGTERIIQKKITKNT